MTVTGHQEPPRDGVPADRPPAGRAPLPPPGPGLAADPAHRLPTAWTRATGLLAALAALGHLLSSALTPWQPSVRPLPLALLAAACVATSAWVIASWHAPAAPAPPPAAPRPWLRAARHAAVAGLSAGAAASLFAPFGPAGGRVWLGLALLAAATTAVGSRVRQARTATAAVDRDLRLLSTAYLAAWPAAWSAYHLLRPADAPLPVLTRLGQLLLVPSVAAVVLTGLLALGVALYGLARRLLGLHD